MNIIKKLIQMWMAFFQKHLDIGKEYRNDPVDPQAQPYTDIERYNIGAIASEKVANLACYEATYEVNTKSDLAKPLQEAALDMQNHKLKFTTSLLNEGNRYIFPKMTGDKIQLIYLGKADVKITDVDCERCKQIRGVVGIKTADNNSVTYYLHRVHTLSDDGDLTVNYEVIDDKNRIYTTFPHWQELQNAGFTIIGANHIGVGIYTSPKTDRDLSPIYGVPINFGCSEMEKNIAWYRQMQKQEAKQSLTKTFVDPRNAQIDEKTGEWDIPQTVIPVQLKAGIENQIQQFTGDLGKIAEYEEAIEKELEKAEAQMGLSKGILTAVQNTSNATATEVEMSSISTKGFVDGVHTALDEGNKMTLEACALYLNIRRDLWEYNSDYVNVFTDSQKQWQELLEAHNNGAVWTGRLTKWQFPDMTDEQIQEELAKVSEGNTANERLAIERTIMH